MEENYKYKHVYSIVKKDIQNGVYVHGTLMPTEQQLATVFGVSRPTICKVYNQLQAEKYVIKKKGSGTVVTYKSTENERLTFGLLLPGAGESEIFSIINDQILKQAEQMKFTCLWGGATASNADIRRNLIETCCDNYIQQNVDGIFFSPLERVNDADRINSDICEKITQHNIPIILIDRDLVPIPGKSIYDVVGLDNYAAGCIMAKHLIDAGCKRIFFFYRPYSAYSVRQRFLAIKDTVQENGLPFNQYNDVCGNPEDLELVRSLPIVKGQTGIICANDSTAAVLMSSLETVGFRICSDLLICGFDNMKYSEHLKYSLTSYQQPCEEIANVSIDLMMRRLKPIEGSALTVHLMGKLIPRESTQFK